MDGSDKKTRIGTPPPRSQPPLQTDAPGHRASASATPSPADAIAGSMAGAHATYPTPPPDVAQEPSPYAGSGPMMPPAQDTLLGKTIGGRYLIEKKLGEGGMGSVYLARHVTLDKEVALKVLHADLARKPELVERFLQEARAASRIRHENVIDITDFGATPEGLVYFAMEVLEGVDLHEVLTRARLEGRRLPWERSRKIFLQVCAALSAAHGKGIVHRDLKPENIYLVEWLGHQDFVKLLDFGIAKLTEVSDSDRKLTRTGMLFGTPEYMSPEQARGEKVDHRVDVYAMGCILHQLLTGQTPFQADNFMGVLSQHLTEPAPVVPADVLAAVGAPPGLAGVVARALEKDRDHRFQSVDEMAAAIVTLESGELPPDFVHPATSGQFGRAPSSSGQFGRAPSASGQFGRAAGSGQLAAAGPFGGQSADASGGHAAYAADTLAPPGLPPAQPINVDAGVPAGRKRTQWTGRVALPETDDATAGSRAGGGRMGVVAAVIAVLVLGGGAAAYLATRGGDRVAEEGGAQGSEQVGEVRGNAAGARDPAVAPRASADPGESGDRAAAGAAVDPGEAIGAAAGEPSGGAAGETGEPGESAGEPAIPDMVRIVFDTEPSGAVIVDERGNKIGTTPFTYSMPGASESRTFRFRRRGYAEGLLELVPDKDGEYTVPLERKRRRPRPGDDDDDPKDDDPKIKDPFQRGK